MAQFITATVNVIVPFITMPIVISYICNNKHPLNFPCRRTQRPLLACRSSSRLRLWPDRSAAKPTWFVFASPALFWADSQRLQRGWYPLPDRTHIILLFSNDEKAFTYAPACRWVCLFVHALSQDLEIWDTAGQESYRSLLPLYYRGACIVVLVYDITNSDSLEQTKWWGWVLTVGLDGSPFNHIRLMAGLD